MLDKLTIYFPYYNQVNALKNQLEHYSNFTREIRDKIIIFIVDDGSEKKALDHIGKKYLRNLNIILYRINIDIPWNQPEANNLAMSNVSTDYVLRIDIDHFIDEPNLSKLMNSDLNLNKNFYKFKRKKNDNTSLKSHPNTYLISQKKYLEVKGYNESLCGNYGHDDFDFLARIKKLIKSVLLNNVTIRVITEHSTKGLVRDSTINKKKLQQTDLPHLFLRNKEHHLKLISSNLKS